MDAERLFEQTILRLTGIKLHVYQQDITPAPTVEIRRPQRVTTFGLSFPDAENGIGKKWDRHVEKEAKIFPTFWQVALHFADWHKKKGGR